MSDGLSKVGPSKVGPSKVRKVGRNFPDYGWAWPTRDDDLLLKAVLKSDDGQAMEAARAWLAAHDLNDTSFREQRLLAAMSDRFGKRLASCPEYPRLVGVQRMLWTRSRIALHDCTAALAALRQAGIAFMFIKGASRIALEDGAQRGRVSHDIDIVVRPASMRGAFEVLMDRGWQAATGAGPLRLKARAESYRAMNFFKGEFGDIDLHSVAYHPSHADAEDDEALWQRAVCAALGGVDALAPAASDRVALAIAHGALDAHTHSDWLVDIDSCIRGGSVDWAILLATLMARNALVPAASALSYLAQEAGSPIPDSFMAELLEAADREPLGRKLSLLECKPKADLNAVTGAARGIAKQIRIWRGKRAIRASREAVWRARLATPAAAPADAAQLSATIAAPRGGDGPVRITILAHLPPVRRRIDWELSTPTRHIAILRHRKLLPGSGWRRLVFHGPVFRELADPDGEDTTLTLTARPTRFLRGGGDGENLARYGAIPFRLVEVRRGGQGQDIGS